MTKTKMKKITPQTLKGFRDFLPEEMRVRQKVIDTLKKVFEAYGFEPLETPALEYAETLLGKYGAEADRLVYAFEDKGGRRVGLRYDLTVPVSRVLAQYRNQIPLPFKRYQIQPVWRAEKPQKSRYREFTQCDIDIFGSPSPLADAEIVAVIYQSLKKLGFKEFTIRINSRQVLFDLIKRAGIPQNKALAVIRMIDKLDKIGGQKVRQEISAKTSDRIGEKILQLIKQAKPDSNLQQVFDALKALKIPERFWKFDPTLARGLDYYTGPIFEAYVEKPKNLSADWRIGSIAGGGRYDQLVSQLDGPDIPATGTTIGLDRICDLIREQNLWPKMPSTKTQVLVTVFSTELLADSIKLAAKLRADGLNAELYPDPAAKLDKQLKYADRKEIPYVIILGPEEVKNKTVTLKNLKTGKQKTLELKNLSSTLAVTPRRSRGRCLNTSEE